MNVLVLNCGSSSIKYQLLDMAGEPTLLAKGLVEKIGLPVGSFTHKPEGKDKYVVEEPIADHTAGIDLILKALVDPKHGVIKALTDINAVGHRVAHGGEFFAKSARVDEDAKKKIAACCELAPLHNPANLKGIETMEKLLPGIPQVALPKEAYIYGLPYKYYEDYRIRRYGFHGTSHKFVAEKACKILGWNIEEKKIITCHLGNGSSITAINKGKSVDTSMGFTPNAGVIMGTRTGDLDLGALLYICEKEGLNAAQANDLVNKKSGLQGVSEVSSDCRDLQAAAESGNDKARLALDILAYDVKKYVGSYAAALNGADLIVFTGGIGENDSEVREQVCTNMEYMGIHFDVAANKGVRGQDKVLSTTDSKVIVMSITTDEELVIATDTMNLVK